MSNLQKKVKRWLPVWKKAKRSKPELDCQHGIGHGGVHGCDGCCSHESFNKAWKDIFGVVNP